MMQTFLSYTAIASLCMIASVLPQQSFANDYEFSGPHTKDNLTIFLVHGKDQIKGKKIITLAEAMEQKKVKVYETGNVQQLAIENLSANEEIYIQSGDIVKGGRQDRVFSTDVLLPAKSGKVAIASFCVESARWSKRGKESDQQFSSSKKRLISKKQKLAAKLYKSQGDVWGEVAKSQDKIAKTLNQSVKDSRSATSLQLTLENKDLEKNVKDYEKSYSSLIDGKDDVIGFVYAINGEFNSADIYASNAMFKKLWPKLLQSSATEALSEKNDKKKTAKLTEKDVITWFAKADNAKAKKEIVNKSTTVITQNSKENVRFDTIDEREKTLIHRNYISH